MLAADFAPQRRAMVESQLRPNKILQDAVLDAMAVLPREAFVPPAAAALSYSDEDVPLGNGRFLLEPMLLARMVQEAQITPTDRVLDIGCATGYSTALLASLSAQVTGIDDDSALLAQATELLRQVGCTARVQAAPLVRGLPEQAPYDVIIVNGAVAVVPDAWGAQLAEGGRLLVIVRGGNAVVQTGVLRLYLKIAGHLSWRAVCDAQTPYLPDCVPPTQFVF
jgi:protein-L-isoaspartate(D-aspartate) O-methyltransferase